ncbi:uncharacterized protein [Nicotiana tomentosiformis]|uniref:uncharacterized protein n=1 Tax=Nicotiana tomentosiformis TaxID=4098 RepID=UPI00388C66B8
MVRRRSTSSSTANNVEIPAANHQEAALEDNGGDSTLPPLTWPKFKEGFRAMFLPSSRMDELRRQFKHLKQGTMSVTEYEMEFTKLAKYAPNLILTEREKVRRFIEIGVVGFGFGFG